jgi:diacylglycerol kinase
MEREIKNNNSHHFSLKERLAGFRYAFRGLRLLLGNEHNFRIHLFVLAVVIAAGFLLKISGNEWIAVALAAGLVLGAESFNTAIEYISDRVSPGEDPAIKKVKDTSAAAVLIIAVAAVIVGAIIFLPRIICLLRPS